jgi:hypothetical protein
LRAGKKLVLHARPGAGAFVPVIGDDGVAADHDTVLLALAREMAKET